MNMVQEFHEYSTKMNEIIVEEEKKVLKRLFNLDTNAFAEGALDKKTKEIVGLTYSMVLRCDDCVQYHLSKCHELGVSSAQMFETFSIAN